MISAEARKKLRLVMQNLETADEIIDSLDAATGYSTNYQQSFTVGEWSTAEAGDTYSIQFLHNLGTLFPIIKLVETGAENKVVEPHKIKIIDSNTIQIFVTQASSDGRFNGRISIDR